MNARDLSNQLADLLRREHGALAEFLVALAAFDRERRWVQLGHSSLFAYLHRDLGLSKGAAFYRMTAAQLIQRHPEVIEPLRDGRLCLTTVVELSKVLTAENAAEVLPRFFHASKSEAREVAAELNSVPAPTRTVMTEVRAVDAAPALALTASRVDDLSRPELTPVSWLDEPVRAATPMAVEPKTRDQSRIHLTVSREFLRKLEAARDALSHSHHGASEAAILEAGLDLLLERSAKRRGLVKKPRKVAAPAAASGSKGERASRHIAAHVRRVVWKRDAGRCQWPLESGGICGSAYRVELDHVIPWAQGGPSTVENVRCLCSGHNDQAARQAYGDAWIERCARGPRRVKEDAARYAAARAARRLQPERPCLRGAGQFPQRSPGCAPHGHEGGHGHPRPPSLLRASTQT